MNSVGCLIKRLITLTVPIKYRTVNLFNENDVDVTASALFSWSTDAVCWTNFVSLEQYNKLAPNIESDFYLRILIVSGFSKLALDNKVVDCYTICLYNENPYLADLCANQTIDFYANLDCALQLYMQLSDLVCCMIGIPCYYFRVLPDQNTADLTFKEYVLHNIVDMKYLKLVCRDGEMPSSKPQMTEFDFDWDVDWEVEMSKTAFAKAFGDTAFPKQRDIIYIPMMKRMWEVNSAYDEKNEGFMWRPVTWKLGLIKWNDKTNVDQGDFESIIDNWAVNRMEDFLPLEHEEQRRQTGLEQMEAPLFRSDNLFSLTLSDAVRAAVTNTERNNVKSLQLNHRAAIVTRDAYQFEDPESVILYQHKYCSDSGTLLFVINIPDMEGEKRLIKIGNVEVCVKDTTLIFDSLSAQLEPNQFYMVHCKWNRANFATEMNVYPYVCTAPEGTPSYSIKDDMYIFDFENPTYLLTGAYNNDFIAGHPVDVLAWPAPCILSNIKVYDKVLELNEAVKESIKYATKNESCVINDVARPFEDAFGFNVR